MEGDRKQVNYLPVTIRALEWLAPVVRPLVYRQRPCDRECLTTSGEVAGVRFWQKEPISSVPEMRTCVKLTADLLSCVCRRICWANVAASEKFCAHTLHWNGRCPVWL